MSDGLNDARAMRIAEVITDYRAIQAQIASYASQSTQDQGPGQVVLNQCIVHARNLLNKPIPSFNQPPSPSENTKLQLQNILLDASSRRFVAWRLHQRAACAIRYKQRRTQLLQGRPERPEDRKALSAIDNALRQEVVAVTDNKVLSELNAKDQAAGNWTAEMPTLAKIQQYISNQGL